MIDLGIVDIERGDFGDTAFLMRCGCIVHLDTAFDGIGLSFGPFCPRAPHAAPPPGPETADRLALAKRHRIAGFMHDLLGGR